MKSISSLTTSTTKIFAGLSLVLAMAASSHAQGFNVDAQISSQAAGNGTFNYTVTVHNEASSTEPIGTFWFAWVPTGVGYDLMNSMPTSITAPSGWFAFANNNTGYSPYPDGWSIEAYNYTGPSAVPGSTLMFTFNSADSPTTLAGTSAFLHIPTLTAYIYSGVVSGNTDQIVVQASPEPSTLGLLMLGSVGVLVVGGWRKLRSL